MQDIRQLNNILSNKQKCYFHPSLETNRDQIQTKMILVILVCKLKLMMTLKKYIPQSWFLINGIQSTTFNLHINLHWDARKFEGAA